MCHTTLLFKWQLLNFHSFLLYFSDFLLLFKLRFFFFNFFFFYWPLILFHFSVSSPTEILNLHEFSYKMIHIKFIYTYVSFIIFPTIDSVYQISNDSSWLLKMESKFHCTFGSWFIPPVHLNIMFLFFRIKAIHFHYLCLCVLFLK